MSIRENKVRGEALECHGMSSARLGVRGPIVEDEM
jgi:hypothetical protein